MAPWGRWGRSSTDLARGSPSGSGSRSRSWSRSRSRHCAARSRWSVPRAAARRPRDLGRSARWARTGVHHRRRGDARVQSRVATVRLAAHPPRRGCCRARRVQRGGVRRERARDHEDGHIARRRRAAARVVALRVARPAYPALGDTRGRNRFAIGNHVRRRDAQRAARHHDRRNRPTRSVRREPVEHEPHRSGHAAGRYAAGRCH